MKLKLSKCDESFTKSAEQSIKIEAIINKSPSQVFEILTTEKIKDCIDDFISYNWLGEELSYGAGSERIIKLKFMTAKEVFINWHKNKRLTFYFDSISIPIAKAIMEDWIIEDAGDNKTNLKWAIYYNPNILSMILDPIIKTAFKRMQKKTIYNLNNI